MTDMKRKRDAKFWWAVAATLSYAFILFILTVFAWAMFLQLTAGSGPVD